MRLFFRKCLWLLPILLAVVGINAGVDPAHLLGPYGEEREVAQLLLQGGDVVIASNFNERMVQRYYIEGLTERKGVVVFGSSRSMQVGSEIFGASFFNNSLPGSSLEDFMGLYHIYHRRDRLPSTIVLCLDPWLLNARNGQTRWKSLRGDVGGLLERLPAAHRLGWEAFPLDKYYQLITPGYFQASFRILMERRLGGKGARVRLAVAAEGLQEGYIKRGDGVWIYPREKREATASQVRAQTREYMDHNVVYSLGEFRRLAPEIQSRFEQFVDLLLQDRVEVIFFLPPYHPLLYECLVHSNEYRIIADAERYFRAVAQSRGIRRVGSYEPAQVGLRDEDFYDALHPKPGAVQTLFGTGMKDGAVS